MGFREVFIEELIKDWNDRPHEYVKSLDRTIEIELDGLYKGFTRKDSVVMSNACRRYGIKNAYGAIKEVLND